jgi:hypothetical protein
MEYGGPAREWITTFPGELPSLPRLGVCLPSAYPDRAGTRRKSFLAYRYARNLLEVLIACTFVGGQQAWLQLELYPAPG